MVELLGYLEANGFTNYIASGGDRDFMRPVTERDLRHPAERVIGSSNALALSRGRARRHGHLRSASRTSSTTARSNRSGSGAGSAAGRSSPAATRTATSRCSGSPAGRVGRHCGCSCSTTTPTASSTTRPAPRSHWSSRQTDGLDRGQRQERLEHRLRGRPLVADDGGCCRRSSRTWSSCPAGRSGWDRRTSIRRNVRSARCRSRRSGSIDTRSRSPSSDDS